MKGDDFSLTVLKQISSMLLIITVMRNVFDPAMIRSSLLKDHYKNVKIKSNDLFHEDIELAINKYQF